MTEQEARAALKGPLKFGDDKQIKAIRFLDRVAETVETMQRSPRCACHGHDEDCDRCDGTGRIVEDWPFWDDDVINAARARFAGA